MCLFVVKLWGVTDLFEKKKFFFFLLCRLYSGTTFVKDYNFTVFCFSGLNK